MFRCWYLKMLSTKVKPFILFLVVMIRIFETFAKIEVDHTVTNRRYTDLSDNPNSDICNILTEIGEFEKNINNNPHKYNVYCRASSILAKFPSRIKSEEEALALYGIGKGIGSKIGEYLKTGKVEKLEEIRQHPRNKAIIELTEVLGIGPVKAKELVDKGIMSTDELKNHLNELNCQQIIGLTYLDDFKKKIPRSEIEVIQKMINEEISKFDKDYCITICGSYRRGKMESRDVDILLTHKNYTTASTDTSDYLKNVVSILQKINFVIKTISLGKIKFMGACKANKTIRHVDMKLVPNDQYFCAVLYYTGNDIFNIKMRKHALSKGFTLNEYSLRPIKLNGEPGESMPVKSERDIFNYIDFPYLKCEQRNL